MIACPDRGYNIQGTVNYEARHQIFDFTLQREHCPAEALRGTCSIHTFITAYYGSETSGAVGSLKLNYEGALLYTDPGSGNGRTTGLDPTGVRPAAGTFPALPIAGPNNAVCIDQEGIAYLADGTFFISDEYGPCKNLSAPLEIVY